MLALIEVLLCSGIPTQLAIGQTLAVAGFAPFGADGRLRTGPFVVLAMTDSVVLIALIALLMHAQGERLRDLLFGTRRWGSETRLGVLLVPVLFVGVGITVLVTRKLMPWTHDVTLSPFEGLLRRPADIIWFGLVVVVAGGIREEVQRAFLLHRFESSLGGSTLGLVIVSICFGLLHKPQGWDAAIATGALGLTWGWLFLRRRSVVAPMVSHAGYDLAQILQAVAVQSLRV
jgi:membrane protease YdiL (CAAX protease family)